MFPIRDSIPSKRTPIVVYAIIALNALVFYYEMKLGVLTGGAGAGGGAKLMQFFQLYGILPARYSVDEISRHFNILEQAIPFVSSMFMHGGIMHFVGNMWMLWIFGDNVEDWFGRVGFLLFYLACGVLSGVIHLFFNWSSTMPTIGASGAIAGVMGAYMLLYPRARVLTLIPIFIFIHFMEIPAVIFLGLWFALQLLKGTGDAVSNVAWWAHIGGFAAGAAFVVLLGGKRYLTRLFSGSGKGKGRGGGRGAGRPSAGRRAPPRPNMSKRFDEYWKK
jgi:membrane associated rhomboid family serine protease